MFWKREKKPLLREIAEGLNISAAREKGKDTDDYEFEYDEDSQQQPAANDIIGRRLKPSPAGTGSRRKILVDDFVVQRYGDQEDIYVEEPPEYPTPGQADIPSENRHPYLKTSLPNHSEEKDNAIPPGPSNLSPESSDALDRKLQSLDNGIDDIHRFARRQEEMLAQWDQVVERIDSLSKIAEDLDRLTPFLTKFYDLERKLQSAVKVEERIQYLESGLERIFPAIENIDDDLRLLAAEIKNTKPDQSDRQDTFPTPDRVRELGSIIDEKLAAFSKLEEKMTALSGNIPQVILPDDRFDRLEQKIDEKTSGLALLDSRLAGLENRLSMISGGGPDPVSGERFDQLERKLDGLLALDTRLGALEEKITDLTNTLGSFHRMDAYLENLTLLQDRLNGFEDTLSRLPRLTQHLEKLDEINQKYHVVENKLEAASELIHRDLAELKESSAHLEEEPDDRQVIMVFDEDQWKEES